MKLSTLLLSLLLVLYVLICGAYGARIGKFSMKPLATSNALLANSLENKGALKNNEQSKLDDFVNEDVKCDDNEDHCSSKGNNRKLISSTIMSTSTTKPIQENLDYGGKKMGIKRNHEVQKLSSSSSSSSSSFHHSIPSTAIEQDKHKEIVPPAEYENAMDMTVMDYSPATKKPPIHN